VRLDQHRQPVTQLEVAGRKTRVGYAVGKAGCRIVGFGKRHVVRLRLRALPGDVGDDVVAQRQAGLAQLRIARVDRLDLDRGVVLELGAIGHVQVDVGQRIPRVHQRQHGLHFRRVGLDVVAIEVEVLCRGAPSHFDRAALVGAVVGREALMAVDVEDGDEDQHLLVERAFGGAAFEHLAQRKEAGILAVDLAGVDAALDQHHRQAALPGRLRRQRTGTVDHQRLHRPAFRGGAEVDAPDLLRISALERRAQLDDFVVAAGVQEARTFGHGGEVGRGMGQRDGGEQGKQQRRTDHR
jgi:hypothetical protein